MRVRMLTAVAVWVLIAAGHGTAADDARDEAIRKELKTLEGNWQLLSLKVGGQDQGRDILDQAETVIKDGVMTIKGGAFVPVMEATLAVNPEANPRSIDFRFTEGPTKGSTYKGIYKREGDFLTFCYSDAGKDRPTEFESREGSGVALVIYRRRAVPVAVAPVPRPAGAVKWEYLVATRDDIAAQGNKDFAAGLNKLGEEGWELVGVDPARPATPRKPAEFFFKRPKQAGAGEKGGAGVQPMPPGKTIILQATPEQAQQFRELLKGFDVPKK